MSTSANGTQSLPRIFVWALISLIISATAARAWIQFRTPLAPGINGAYYFVQARAVLETGVPGVPDLPLTFWVHAGIARIIESVSRLSQTDAIVWAVKCADSFLPTLSLVALAWLGWRWDRRNQTPSITAAIVPGMIAVLSAQALSMTGDFQKNSLGLVWLAALAPAAHRFLTQPSVRTAWAPLTLLILLGLTHVGVLGAALVFSGVLVVTAIFVSARKTRRALLLTTAIGALLCVIAASVVYAFFDPARVSRLTKALAEPSSFNESGPRGRPPGPPRGMSDRPHSPDALFNGPQAPDPGSTAFRPNGPGAMGGPPGGPGGVFQPSGAIFLGLSALGLGAVWWRRKIITPADIAIATAAAVTAGALGGPFFDNDKAQRLTLIAIIPAAMTVSFLLAAIPRALWRRFTGLILAVAVTAGAALYLPRAGQPTISEDTYAELKTLREFAPENQKTLIVARHGLEWWTAWVLHTHIAQPQAVKPDDWEKFDGVYYLTEKWSEHRGGPGSRGRVPPDSQGMRRPEIEAGGPPMRRGPWGGGLGMTQIPAKATIVHDGPQLKLAHAPEPPAAEPDDTW